MKPSPIARIRVPTGAPAWALACALAAACAPLQRIPGPMYGPEPEPAEVTPTAVQALVVRHAGPVWVFRPGATEGYALPFHRKRETVDVGGRVRVGRGGRAEIFWPGSTSSAVLYENGWASLGDRERGEPLLAFGDLSRVQLSLTPGDGVVLPGGAELRGGASGTSGALLVERTGVELLRALNPTAEVARVLFGGEVLEIEPGDAIALPIVASLGSGAARGGEGDAALGKLLVGGIALGIVGRVTPSELDGGVRLVAQEASRVEARGVVVRLGPRQEAVFSDLDPDAGREAGTR